MLQLLVSKFFKNPIVCQIAPPQEVLDILKDQYPWQLGYNKNLFTKSCISSILMRIWLLFIIIFFFGIWEIGPNLKNMQPAFTSLHNQ